MNNDQLLAAVLALPDADLMTETKLDDAIGAGAYYRADTVARLLAAERERIKRLIVKLLAGQTLLEAEHYEDEDEAFVAANRANAVTLLSWIDRAPELPNHEQADAMLKELGWA